jgi:hypothetical protein
MTCEDCREPPLHRATEETDIRDETPLGADTRTVDR